MSNLFELIGFFSFSKKTANRSCLLFTIGFNVRRKFGSQGFELGFPGHAQLVQSTTPAYYKNTIYSAQTNSLEKNNDRYELAGSVLPPSVGRSLFGAP